MIFPKQKVLSTTTFEDTGMLSSRETNLNTEEGKHDTSSLFNMPTNKYRLVSH